ncbi:MAG TPA: HD-GYP domain-containing protein [Clostridiaceae bacterium]|nr:HD-GYP domain-containing protein [Clostridiaceae bacterium]
MRKVYVDNIVSGMKLAKAVFSHEGRILLASGIELKRRSIDKLRRYNISQIYVDDEVFGFSEIDDEACKQTVTQIKRLAENSIIGYSFSSTADVIRLKNVIAEIADELLDDKHILQSLSDLYTVDSYTFEHSVNVCIISVMIGIAMNFCKSRLKDLGIGALLHDIGKLRIPEEILKKPFRLTEEEFEEVKKHTIYGYEILKNNNKFGKISSYIALEHHERCDGSGYPLKLERNSIHLYSRIVSVADVFNALTTDRVYRKKMEKQNAFKYIMSLGSHHLDKEITDVFIKYIDFCPIRIVSEN